MEAETTPIHSIPKEKMLAIPFMKPQKENKKVKGTLQPREWEMATFKDDEILIEVRAFGLNFADVIARKGYYDDAPPYPFVPGYECSGVIAAMGDAVPQRDPEDTESEGFFIGQRVLATTPFGSYAQYAAAPYLGVFPLPEGMSFAEGASIPVVFATAYYSIFFTGPVSEGDKVLVHAAAGGLGLASVQLCKNAGCEVFGTASKPEKLEMLKNDFGVDHTINYRKKDFEKEIKQICTEGDGHLLDLILDSVGGSQFKKDMALLRATGRLVGLGAASFVDRTWGQTLKLLPHLLSMVTFSAINMMLGSQGFFGVNMKRIGDEKPMVLHRALFQVLQLFKEGKLRTCLLGGEGESVFPWTKVGEVHELMEARKTKGKIVFVIPEEREDKEGPSGTAAKHEEQADETKREEKADEVIDKEEGQED